MDNAKQLGEDKVSKLLLRFSIPAIVGMLVNALYNVVDRIFVGNGVGSVGIAGITIGFPIMNILMAFAMLMGIGSTTLISIRLGQQKKEEAELIAANGMAMLIIVPIVISAVGLIFMDPMLKAFGASDAVLPYARSYVGIILYGAVFQSVGMGMNNYIRAEGSPRIAMMTMLIGAILNTILDPIFIYTFNWGVGGAAFATILSQAVSALWVLQYFFGGRSMLKIHLKNLRPKFNIVKKIAAVGSAPFSMQLAASLLNMIMNRSLSYYGNDTAISGMGVINSITMLILMPIFGINQGVQPIIGYNYGAKKFNRVKEALKYAMIAASSVVTLGFIATRLFPEQFISIFNSQDKELLAFGNHALTVFLIFLPIIGFQIVGSNYFQAIGKPKYSMFLSLSRQVLVLIPAILILPIFFGLEGILAAGPVSDFISSILTGLLLFRELKRLDIKHEQSLADVQTMKE